LKCRCKKQKYDISDITNKYQKLKYQLKKHTYKKWRKVYVAQAKTVCSGAAAG
jgi:hypothetical protein